MIMVILLYTSSIFYYAEFGKEHIVLVYTAVFWPAFDKSHWYHICQFKLWLDHQLSQHGRTLDYRCNTHLTNWAYLSRHLDGFLQASGTVPNPISLKRWTIYISWYYLQEKAPIHYSTQKMILKKGFLWPVGLTRQNEMICNNVELILTHRTIITHPQATLPADLLMDVTELATAYASWPIWSICPDIWMGFTHPWSDLSRHLDGSLGPPAPYLSRQLDSCYAYNLGSWHGLLIEMNCQDQDPGQ